MAKLLPHKNEVGGYAYNDAQTCVTHIERVLEQQMFEDSMDEMKGMASTTSNTLTAMKSAVSVRKRDVLQVARDAATSVSTP